MLAEDGDESRELCASRVSKKSRTKESKKWENLGNTQRKIILKKSESAVESRGTKRDMSQVSQPKISLDLEAVK